MTPAAAGGPADDSRVQPSLSCCRTSETIEEIMTTLSDPKNVITMVPQNTLKYAQFMYDIGSLKHRATSWKELFFPEVHDLPGN